MKNKLYGDGIHDDYPAIQEMIDSGACEITLPTPEKCYLISKTLIIHSYFKLKLPRYAEIKLMDGADCFMVRNETIEKFAERVPDFMDEEAKAAWWFVNEWSPDKEDACHDFEIEGGIWNFNNKGQTENPIWTHRYDEKKYNGYGMMFYNVKNFRLSNMTLKDPVNFAVVLDTASYFTVENIDFDFNYGNPTAVNMDGIHLDGNCHFGVLRNLKGTCYDDLVALNAHEGHHGDITNITIDGIYAENCHSAVRLLTVIDKIENIHITNVHGTYYQYCIGVSKFFPGETKGHYDGLHFDRIYASKAERLPVYMKFNSYVFPIIWVQGDVKVKNLHIDGVHRIETDTPVETIHVGKSEVESLIINDVTQENHTNKGDMPLFVNNGQIARLQLTNIRAGGQSEIVNNGTIANLVR